MQKIYDTVQKEKVHMSDKQHTHKTKTKQNKQHNNNKKKRNHLFVRMVVNFIFDGGDSEQRTHTQNYKNHPKIKDLFRMVVYLIFDGRDSEQTAHTKR